MSWRFCPLWQEAELAYLTAEPIDVGALLREVQSPERGAIASFQGIVRNHQAGRTVVRLDYSAYVPMAEAVCQEIVEETQSRWDVAVAVQHRIGRLSVGDTAVAVAAASAHRDEAFLACRYVIEEVKRRVPIWKQEHYADGSVVWVGVGGEADKAVSGEEGKRVSGAGKVSRSEWVGEKTEAS